MVNIPVHASPARTLAVRIGNLGELGQFATELQEPVERVLDKFPLPPPQDCLHIIVQKPLAGRQSRAAPNKGIIWLEELHSIIWGREDLKGTLFRTVKVTRAHYDVLQENLNKKYPDRIVGKSNLEVLNSPVALLRSRDSEDRTDDDDEMEPGNGNENGSDCEINSFFPFTLHYLDLSVLNLKNKSDRFPQPLLYRQEYLEISKIIDNRKSYHGKGSVIISGQPGTGKTAYLYLRIVDSLIAGSPFLYQTMDGDVYHVTQNGVEAITEMDQPPPEGIAGFVDADQGVSQPKRAVTDSGLVQIIVATSPKGADEYWLKQTGDHIKFIQLATSLWSPSELFLTGIFLHPYDITFKLLLESTSFFGYNPRRCFNSSTSVAELEVEKKAVSSKIRTAARGDIMQLVMKSRRDEANISHTIFQIYPFNTDPNSNLNRLLSDCHYDIVSRWALDSLLAEYEANETVTFFRKLAKIPEAGPLLGHVFEWRVLNYLGLIENELSFGIRRLSPIGTSSNQVTWIYRGHIPRRYFQEPAVIDEIKKAVQNKRPVHLVPLIFPAVDSILYDPKDLNVITCIQVTRRPDHPIEVSGLKRIQRWLGPRTSLNDLRPTSTKPWRFLFVVPQEMAATFKLQNLVGDTDKHVWAGKVEQYVLGLKEETVLGGRFDLSVQRAPHNGRGNRYSVEHPSLSAADTFVCCVGLDDGRTRRPISSRQNFTALCKYLSMLQHSVQQVVR